MQSHMYVSGVHGTVQQQGEKLQDIAVFLPTHAPRVPVLRFLDTVRAESGVRIHTHTLESDAEIDETLTQYLGEKPSFIEAPTYPRETVLLVAGGDAFLRAVARRLLRRSTPRASKRPEWLPHTRTIADLPPLSVLELEPHTELPSLAHTLNLPHTPQEFLRAVENHVYTHVDVLRNDHGSLTLNGVLLGSADEQGHTLGWRASVYVDEHEIASPEDVLVAVSVCNGPTYTHAGGVQLIESAHPCDGVLHAAAAVYTSDGGVQVRRAQGRACSIDPLTDAGVHFTDDGVNGVLTRKKTWWVEPGALPLRGTSLPPT